MVSWWVLYRVGSRNERTGQTGISHWVEHMLSKGTDRFPAGTLDKAIDREGGVWNAQTSFDYTAYFETLPAGRTVGARSRSRPMVSARFDPEEVESERTVIISERQGRRTRRHSGCTRKRAPLRSACIRTTTRLSVIWPIYGR